MTPNNLIDRIHPYFLMTVSYKKPHLTPHTHNRSHRHTQIVGEGEEREREADKEGGREGQCLLLKYHSFTNQ